MVKEDVLEYEGVVLEILPNAMFKVKLDNEHEILAHTADVTTHLTQHIITQSEVLGSCCLM